MYLNCHLQCGKQYALTIKSMKNRIEINFCAILCQFFERLPFDWKNPLGHSITITFEYVVVSYSLLIAACSIALGVVSYLYVIASSKCIKGSLFSISRCASVNANRQISNQFIEFIAFHSRVKQLSLNWSVMTQIIRFAMSRQ